MRRGPRLLTALALVAGSTLIADPARADEIDRGSSGVQIGVDISPLECVRDCVGELPATGAHAPMLFVWLAAVLLVGGLALLVWRRGTRTPGAEATRSASSPYYVVSGRRADGADDGSASSPTEAAPRRGGASGRQIE